MLRGAIDFVSAGCVAGWIYSDIAPTAGRTILAFLDGVCLGAGEVNLYRQDLVNAGLGDGLFGFSIGVAPVNPRDFDRIIVKLEGSDLFLAQPCARVVDARFGALPDSPLLESMARIEWMRKQGWLNQSELDFAKQLVQIGAYDFSLRNVRQPDGTLNSTVKDPASVARMKLSLLSMQDIDPAERQLETLAELSNTAVMQSLRHPVVAIWSQKRDSVLVVEGSHHDEPHSAALPLQGGVEYACGPDRLLFIDLRTRFGSPFLNGTTSYIVFLADATAAQSTSAAALEHAA